MGSEMCIRDSYEDDPGGEYDSLVQIIPRFSVSGNFTLEKEKMRMVSYSGNLLLEIPYINHKDRESVKDLLIEDPYVLACFENALQSGLIIIVRGNGKPEVHSFRFKLAVEYYKKLTGAKIFSLAGMRAKHTCMVSMDKDIYIGLESVPFSNF